MKKSLPLTFLWWLVPSAGLVVLAGSVLLWSGKKPETVAPADSASVVNPTKKGEKKAVERKVDFASEVLPVLSEKCFACHGPDEHTRYGGYRLDVEAEAKSQKYKAVVPFHPELSNAVLRVTTDNPKQVMPPLSTHKYLTPEQIQTLKLWIAQGAKYDQHWAYKTLERPLLPKVSNTSWCKNEVDTFVLAKLEEKGFQPSAPAEKSALLRRLSLDLTGLPPTPEEVEKFISDSSVDAYEKQVDRLLALPAFGEHMATPWLDLARYADSQGYEKDTTRTIWAYRDWVIDAYNHDMPFDQFITRQLAGDLLENPTQEDYIATAFNRNTLTNDEGGTDDEEYRNIAVHDRTFTTMEGCMGLTFMCAQCHTHKYDPILHEDYYHLFAFFNQSEDSDKADERPTMEVKDVNGENTSVMIMRDLDANNARKTYLLSKGSFLTPDKERGEMLPDTPKFLPPFPKDAPRNRLGLAKWIVAKENPLTARVQVNRIWASLFGRGIVSSLEDMGLQSAQPTHRELLDFMADTWRSDMNWSPKKLIRLMVTSATYQQSSVVSKEASEHDIKNQWLARGPRFRLTAEQLRDQALAVSGLLNPQMYGVPAMPWLPAEAIPNKPYSGQSWNIQEGAQGRRRAVYVKIERGMAYPALSTFDTPLRDRCSISRPPTNTPLQALIALNDPVYNECHQNLARLALAQKADGEKVVSAPIVFAFKRALLREPTAQEIKELVDYYTTRRAWFEQNASEALLRATDSLGALPDHMNVLDAAAMTDVCAVIMNLDEYLTKG